MSNKVCANTLLNIDIFNFDCLSLFLSKLFGYAGVLALGKLFTLMNMINCRSSKGLDAMSLYLEQSAFFTTVYYGFLMGNGISTYIDNISAGVQVTLMIMVMWWYESSDLTKLLSDHSVILAIAVVFYSTMCTVTHDYYYVIIFYSIMVKLMCKVPQIIANFRTKHTGVQSLSSLSVAAFNGLVKVLITLREMPDDPYLLLGAVLSLILTVILMMQGIVYGGKNGR